jgi:hypothetical protein
VCIGSTERTGDWKQLPPELSQPGSHRSQRVPPHSSHPKPHPLPAAASAACGSPRLARDAITSIVRGMY